MIRDVDPILQALLGTCFTWGLTAAGAFMVVFFKGTQPKLLDSSLGFAAGVMTAASYWSLLAPAIEMSSDMKPYNFVPACVGFLLGAGFTFAADIIISKLGIESPSFLLAKYTSKKMDGVSDYTRESPIFLDTNFKVTENSLEDGVSSASGLTRRRGQVTNRHPKPAVQPHDARVQWKRILLLIIAITVHNVPEGLAVGVSFGSLRNSNTTTFLSARNYLNNAEWWEGMLEFLPGFGTCIVNNWMTHAYFNSPYIRNLAIGIGIQNFPEGLAVSLPLKAAGFSTLTSFWYGQLSGMVEPVFGLIGALLVTAAKPILPYAMAFAAGAMIYVVVDDIIPEANTKGNGSLASWGVILGFIVMMMLEVGLEDT